MSVAYFGTSVIAKNPEQTFSVRSGYRFRQEYLCRSGSVQATVLSLVASGYDPVEVKPGDGMWTVVANSSTDPNNPVPRPSWQKLKYSVDGDILDPKTNPTAAKVHPKHLQVLRAARKNPPREGALPVFDGTVTTFTSTPSEQLRLAMTLWAAIQFGHGGATLEYPILRRSYQVPDSYIITDTLFNVGDTIISTGTLIGSEGVPNAYASVIPSSGNVDISVPYLTYKTGWIKYQPDIVSSGENQSQVSQEWKYGKWLTLDYPNSI